MYFTVINANNVMHVKKKIFSTANIVYDAIQVRRMNGLIVKNVSLATQVTSQTTFIVKVVRNVTKDLKKMLIIVSKTINVIIVLRAFFSVINVKAATKGQKKNIFIVKLALCVIRANKKIGFIVINAGNAILDKKKTITIVKNAMYAYNF